MVGCDQDLRIHTRRNPNQGWLWVAIEPESKEVLRLNISKERNMFVADRFLSNVVKEYREHPVSTDEGTWYP
jgi:putative transposase